MKAVRIEWIDSVGGGAWELQRDVEKYRPALITTVGMVLREDDESITIIQSADGMEPPRVDNYIVIPKFAIQKRRNAT